MSDEDCPQIKSVTKRGERSDQRECGGGIQMFTYT